MVPLWRQNLRILWIAQFIAMIGVNACLPFLPLYIRTLGISDLESAQRWSGIINSAPFFFSVVAAPIWGALGDRYGRKPMVVRAIAGLAVSMTLMGFAVNIWQLFALRLLQGIISGFVAASLSFVSATTPAGRSGYAIGILQSTVSAGGIVGAMFGGALSDAIGMHNVFYVVGAMCLISAGIVVKYVVEPPTYIDSSIKISILNNLRVASADKGLRNILMLIVSTQIAIVFVTPIIPFYLEHLGAPNSYLSTITGMMVGVVGIFSVIFAPFWGRRNDRGSYSKTLFTVSLATTISMIAQAFAPNYIVLFIIRAATGIFSAALIPTLYSAFNKSLPAVGRSGLMGFASSATLLGNLIGPIISGFIAPHFGMEACFLIASGFMAVAVAQSFFAKRNENEFDASNARLN